MIPYETDGRWLNPLIMTCYLLLEKPTNQPLKTNNVLLGLQCHDDPPPSGCPITSNNQQGEEGERESEFSTTILMVHTQL